jgi:hypothetical protein
MKSILIVALCVLAARAGVAEAADSTEIWPEASAFVQLSDRARLYLDASYAADKESDIESLGLSAFLDISLLPIVRRELRSHDWQRSRYFWSRIGYTHIVSAENSTRGEPEDRGVVSLYAKAPLPADFWLEARARADLRWIGDDYSTRYRFRLEATREFTVREHPIVPYFNYEWFYDTRYEDWTRTFGQLGFELTVNEHFRFEIYLARQVDRIPDYKTLDAVGLVAKWYY